MRLEREKLLERRCHSAFFQLAALMKYSTEVSESFSPKETKIGCVEFEGINFNLLESGRFYQSCVSIPVRGRRMEGDKFLFVRSVLVDTGSQEHLICA